MYRCDSLKRIDLVSGANSVFVDIHEEPLTSSFGLNKMCYIVEK